MLNKNGKTEMSAEEAMMILVRTEMRPFSLEDYDAYAGVSVMDPMIGEWFNYIVILDGNELEIQDTTDSDSADYDYEGSTFQFTLKAG